MKGQTKGFGETTNRSDSASPAAAYVRMSTDHQKYSTENQLDTIRRYADQRGFEIVRVFEDSGKSGLRIDGRDGLQHLMREVQSGSVNFRAILVYDVSARENLDVTTIIYANRSYAVLHEEMEKVGAAEGVRAFSMLDLHNPSLDWVQLAQGMGVEAVRVDTCHGLHAAFRSAIAASGPRLIEALV